MLSRHMNGVNHVMTPVTHYPQLVAAHLDRDTLRGVVPRIVQNPERVDDAESHRAPNRPGRPLDPSAAKATLHLEDSRSPPSERDVRGRAFGPLFAAARAASST